MITADDIVQDRRSGEARGKSRAVLALLPVVNAQTEDDGAFRSKSCGYAADPTADAEIGQTGHSAAKTSGTTDHRLLLARTFGLCPEFGPNFSQMAAHASALVPAKTAEP